LNKQSVVLVTGASAGIGKATVALLIQEGFIVYAAARLVEQMRDIESKGAHIIVMDVTNENL